MARSAFPHIFSALGLSRRGHASRPGMFTYVDPTTKASRVFIWDDAGIDETGRLVLLEEEAKGIVPLHVEGHIARLKLMMNRGESIGGVVWVVDRKDFNEMLNLLRFYRSSLGPLPQMEIWSGNGIRLASLE